MDIIGVTSTGMLAAIFGGMLLGLLLLFIVISALTDVEDDKKDDSDESHTSEDASGDKCDADDIVSYSRWAGNGKKRKA